MPPSSKTVSMLERLTAQEEIDTAEQAVQFVARLPDWLAHVQRQARASDSRSRTTSAIAPDAFSFVRSGARAASVPELRDSLRGFRCHGRGVVGRNLSICTPVAGLMIARVAMVFCSVVPVVTLLRGTAARKSALVHGRGLV